MDNYIVFTTAGSKVWVNNVNEVAFDWTHFISFKGKEDETLAVFNANNVAGFAKYEENNT